MPIDLATAALWQWSTRAFCDLVVDLRPPLVREKFPVPISWKTTIDYPVEGTDWALEAMLDPNPNPSRGTYACSGYWRFTGPDGFRFVVAVQKDSDARSLPTGKLASVMPSLRMVLRNDTAVSTTSNPRGAWEYNLDALTAAVEDPRAWLIPGIYPEGKPQMEVLRDVKDGLLMPQTFARMLLTWSLVDRPVYEARGSERHGFSPIDVGKWVHPQEQDSWGAFDIEEAWEWGKVFGVKHPNIADSWRRGGFTLVEARRWKHAPRSPALSPLEDPRNWAKVTDPAKRNAYMSARFTGKEAAGLENSAEPPTVDQIELLASLRG